MLILGNRKKNKLFGTASNDTIDGGKGNDKLYGNAGNDVLIGSKGKDQLFGGTGDDTYVVNLIKKGSGSKKKAIFEDKVYENAGEGNDTVVLNGSVTTKKITTLFLPANVENLDASLTGATKLNIIGNASNNILTGNAFANIISGDLGNDILIGLGGIDTLIGGAGEDLFYFGSYGYSDYDQVADFTSGQDKIGLTSSPFNSVAQFILKDMFVEGTSATDNNDFLIYDKPTGSLYYDADGNGASTQQIIARFNPGTTVKQSDFLGALDGVSGEILFGDSVNTVVTNDNMVGTTGFDILYGFGGDDTLDGGAGYDTLIGGIGDDTYVLNIGQTIGSLYIQDQIIELAGGGTDTVKLEGTLDGAAVTPRFTLANTLENLDASAVTITPLELVGNASANIITGNAENNAIAGLGGHDEILGGSGDDILSGGTGNDILNGGAGLDIFIFDAALNALNNIDTIQDFNVADDQIHLSATIFAAIGTTLDSSEFISGAGFVVAADGDDRIIFDSTTGALYYDADGDGGGAVAIRFATLTSPTGTLTEVDFSIV